MLKCKSEGGVIKSHKSNFIFLLQLTFYQDFCHNIISSTGLFQIAAAPNVPLCSLLSSGLGAGLVHPQPEGSRLSGLPRRPPGGGREL